MGLKSKIYGYELVHLRICSSLVMVLDYGLKILDPCRKDTKIRESLRLQLKVSFSMIKGCSKQVIVSLLLLLPLMLLMLLLLMLLLLLLYLLLLLLLFYSPLKTAAEDTEIL